MLDVASVSFGCEVGLSSQAVVATGSFHATEDLANGEGAFNFCKRKDICSSTR